jgi:hypothetical protein
MNNVILSGFISEMHHARFGFKLNYWSKSCITWKGTWNMNTNINQTMRIFSSKISYNCKRILNLHIDLQMIYIIYCCLCLALRLEK